MERVYRRNVLSQQVCYKFKTLQSFWNVIRRLNGESIFLWVILVAISLLDSFLGIAVIEGINRSCGLCLQQLIGDCISDYILGMLRCMRWLLEWLMNVPAGLKLNNQLTEFLSEKFIILLRLWEYFYISFIANHLQFIVWCVFSTRYMGITVVLSIWFDFLKFLNLWLICFYVFSCRILWIQLTVLRSLFRLFIGCKWNPLRERVDSCDYDPNQLLLGTLFFTTLLFLLPTTAMFFGVFLSLRIVQYSIQSMIRLFIIGINRVTAAIIRAVHARYTRPQLSTLQFKVQEDGKKISVVGLWNNEKLQLQEIVQMLEASDCNRVVENVVVDLEKHPMYRWFDLNPF